MAEFLTTQGTSYYLENIIINASERLILVSLYLNISANFMARLQDADKREVDIILSMARTNSNHRKNRNSLSCITFPFTITKTSMPSAI